MDKSARLIAIFSTAAMCVFVLLLPGARASEAPAAKIQDRAPVTRISPEFFSSEAMLPANGLDAGVLAARGDQHRKSDRAALYGAACAQATWPEIPLRCLFISDETQPRTRSITVIRAAGPGITEALIVPEQVATR